MKTSDVPDKGNKQPASNSDIGDAVSPILTTEDRAFSKNLWVPKSKDDFPWSTHSKSGVPFNVVFFRIIRRTFRGQQSLCYWLRRGILCSMCTFSLNRSG